MLFDPPKATPFLGMKTFLRAVLEGPEGSENVAAVAAFTSDLRRRFIPGILFQVR